MFSSKSKSKFMLSIGEEGIMLLYFKNNTLNKRYRLVSQQKSHKNSPNCIIKSKNTSNCVAVYRL
ncbi:hypothetical protein EA652_0598 [Wolbachia endosymbiont of Drosophila ananassae]|nr:hypothetical protein EA652_0598 [Wolbachia endosymbiont of Drosophila ananassae]